MVKRASVFAVLLLLVSAVASYAASPSFNFGANAGVRSFTGDAEDWKTGLMIGVDGDYVINPMWAAGVDFSWNKSKHTDDGTQGVFGTVSDELTLTEFGVHGKYMIPMKGTLQPYLVAGLGSYSVKVDYSDGPYSESGTDSKMGFRGGLGANYMLNPQVGLNAEANFHSISTEGSSTTFYGVGAGVMYHWSQSK
jgi:opacity protein-like surface antigen